MTKDEQLRQLYLECGLEKEDVYKHQHYVIITRTGIEKIQYKKNIKVTFEVVNVSPNFCVVKGIGEMDNEVVESFGSALYGAKEMNDKGKWIDTGTTTTWYVMEMAEKRALSRVVLKLTKLYALGVFGQDESEDFKKSQPNG
jgi:hypothetical protein